MFWPARPDHQNVSSLLCPCCLALFYLYCRFLSSCITSRKPICTTLIWGFHCCYHVSTNNITYSSGWMQNVKHIYSLFGAVCQPAQMPLSSYRKNYPHFKVEYIVIWKSIPASCCSQEKSHKRGWHILCSSSKSREWWFILSPLPKYHAVSNFNLIFYFNMCYISWYFVTK